MIGTRPAALAALLAIAGPACGGRGADQPAAPVQPSTTRGPQPPVAPVITPEEAARLAERAAREASPQRATSTPPPAPTPLVPFAVEPEAAEKKPERDLGAELSAAVGNLATCVKPRTAAAGTAVAGTTLSISLEAVVTETGIVTRSSVRGSGLEPDELDCARRRLSGVRLTAPIEAAPRTITSSVSLTLQPAAPAPGAAAPTAPAAPAAPGTAPTTAPASAPTGAGYP